MTATSYTQETTTLTKTKGGEGESLKIASGMSTLLCGSMKSPMNTLYMLRQNTHQGRVYIVCVLNDDCDISYCA